MATWQKVASLARSRAHPGRSEGEVAESGTAGIPHWQNLAETEVSVVLPSTLPDRFAD
jgi:hypothetical protein